MKRTCGLSVSSVPVIAALLSLLAAALAPASDWSAAAEENTTADADHYARCMAETRRNPAAADRDAQSWLVAGGGHPAEHCGAVALVRLGRYQDGARRLAKLASEIKAPLALRAQTLDQAGQAWLLAGRPDKAATVLSEAVAVEPDDPDILTDRAEAFAGERNDRAALGDLDHALALAPQRVDALVFRAAAYRRLHRLEPALHDVEAALRLAPNDPDALLERGTLRHQMGDDRGARADWQRIAGLAPGDPAETAARDDLAALDVATGRAAPGKAP